MRAGYLRTLWIMLTSVIVTFRIMLFAIYRSYTKPLSREEANVHLQRWANSMLDVIKLQWQIHNPNNIDFAEHRPCIIMVNHSSLYDIPISLAAIPGSMRMLAKKELYKIPLFGRTLSLIETVKIDRHNREQAIEDLKVARERMESGILLWIAPEGTRSRDGSLGRLKKGGFIMAIEAGATIIPVGIRGANKILPAKTFHFHLDQTVDVHIGTPVDASQYSMSNKEDLIATVEKQLRELADL